MDEIKFKGSLSWCLGQQKGIRLVDKNENLCKVYLRKSESALNMLSSAVEKREWEWILETSYYARYFSVYSFLMKIGIKCEIHDCTIKFISSLVDNNILDKSFFEELRDSKNLRINSLYYNKDFSHDLILKFAKSAPDFCLRFEDFVEGVSEEVINKIGEIIK